VVEAAGPADAGAVWDAFGGTALVVQRTPNNLTGTGTAMVHDVTGLGSVLRSWAGQRLKVSEFIHGTDLTVSGCVGPAHTLLSGVSHQLVGIPEVTPTWGAHCGNQLLDSADGWGSAIGQCQRIAELVGDRLRERGFLGLFGLDLIVGEDGTVRLLELNPRIQSVTSLLNHVEADAGLLPLPGAHLLALLGVEVPVVDIEVPRVPALSQLVVTAHEAHRVGAVPAEGRYRVEGTRTRLTHPGCAGPPPAPDEVLVWRFARPGDQIKADDRIFVAMFGRHVAPVGVRPTLDGYVTEVLRDLWQAADPDVSGRAVP
jgi:hypothetical protein